MKLVRRCLPVAVAGLVAGCATPPPPALFIVSPGTGRDQAAFQQDSETCQQDVKAGTGYGIPAPPAASGTPAPASAWIASEDTRFLQCMAARGDVVAPAPASYAADYPGFAYGYAYPFGYFDPYPVYFGGVYGGFAYGGWRYRGWGAHGGWGHGGWGHGGWGHGGWGHGGYARAGGGGHGGGHH
nr:hypothetical protein [uncultured Rhodopila sp.]